MNLRNGLLSMAGLAALTGAVWDAWGQAAGLAAAGISLVLIDFMTDDKGDETR